jgi:hypothetical protein
LGGINIIAPSIIIDGEFKNTILRSCTFIKITLGIISQDTGLLVNAGTRK